MRFGSFLLFFVIMSLLIRKERLIAICICVCVCARARFFPFICSKHISRKKKYNAVPIKCGGQAQFSAHILQQTNEKSKILLLGHVIFKFLFESTQRYSDDDQKFVAVVVGFFYFSVMLCCVYSTTRNVC